MPRPSALAVYCGSRPGADPRHHAAARRLGDILAGAGVALVYGGGSVGLMGAVADGVMGGGGRAIGVIPRFLMEREVGHRALTELQVVETMHERKMAMFDMADGYVVLAGGIGTLEELFEVVSWRVLGLHDKPVVVVDDGGYWQPLRDLLARVVDSGFADARQADNLHFVGSVDEILPLLGTLPSRPTSPDISRT